MDDHFYCTLITINRRSAKITQTTFLQFVYFYLKPDKTSQISQT